MESVLTAFIVIFLMLFAALTLSYAVIHSQETLGTSWQNMQERLADQSNVRLAVLDAETNSSGAVAQLTIENLGSAKLADFTNWDVIVHYYDNSAPAAYRIQWLPYDAGVLTPGQWGVEGFYGDAANDETEAFEPGVFNPGEEMVIQLALTPAAGAGTPIQVTLATGEGSETSMIFYANHPPILASNAGLSLIPGASEAITTALLQSTDADDDAAELIYTLVSAPAQGTLSLTSPFTQADIDNSLLTYTHTGSGDDSFTFTVSDGKDTIGSYTFTITVNEPPTLAVNTGLTMPAAGIAVIQTSVLQVNDPDTPASQLVYTVTDAPDQGTLNLGSTFTQQDIDSGLLSYSHTGSSPDSFTFSVSDGENTIDNLVFTINIS